MGRPRSDVSLSRRIVQKVESDPALALRVLIGRRTLRAGGLPRAIRKADTSPFAEKVLDAGYRGWVGIEYEGPDADEIAGVKACQRLLARFQ